MKDKRLELRISGSQKEIIEEAAALTGRSVSDFSTDVLTRRAEEIIRSDRELRMNATAFDEFVALLDEPPKTIDGLVDLFRRPTVFRD
ncbi:DUF1778 domain-containing protein [Leifsonia sp. ku-ls]|nr:DUF1778 domain-containing protein [Leifsonia sp. ku-ls]